MSSSTKAAMLTLQVLRRKDVILADYRSSPNTGNLTSVHPGGTFMGFSFEELRKMGTGTHEVAALDPYDFLNTGVKPQFESEFRAKLAHFEFALFGYQVGAYTVLEVLSIARDVS